MHRSPHLELEGRHVGVEALPDEGVGATLEVGKALGHDAFHASQNLQVSRDAEIVQGNGHGLSSGLEAPCITEAALSS